MIFVKRSADAFGAKSLKKLSSYWRITLKWAEKSISFKKNSFLIVFFNQLNLLKQKSNSKPIQIISKTFNFNQSWKTCMIFIWWIPTLYFLNNGPNINNFKLSQEFFPKAFHSLSVIPWYFTRIKPESRIKRT